MAENKENLQEETVEETVENTEPTAEEKLTAELNEKRVASLLDSYFF